MQKYKVEFTRPALEDIERIADYHLRVAGVKSAEKITSKLLDAFDLLCDYPLSGAVHPDPVLQKYGYRKLICGDYVGIYKLAEETVYIYGIFHGAVNYPELFKP